MEPTTVMEYKKTSCYFCSEWLENGSFKEHVRSCGQVLEKCPNHCHAYVQRKNLEAHLKECPKTTKATNGSSFVTSQSLNDVENRLLVLEQDIQTFRSALNEEIRQRLHLITDIGALKRRNEVTDEWVAKVSDILAALKKCMNEETQSRCIDVEKCRDDIGRLIYQYQEMDEWRMEVGLRLDEVVSNVIQEDNWRGHIELLEAQNVEQSRKIAQVAEELKALKMEVSEDRTEVHQANFMTDEKFGAIDLILEDQHKALTAAKGELSNTLSALQAEVDSRTKTMTELAAKQATLDFELKNMKHIVHETEDKCDKFDKVSTETKAVANRTRQEMNDLEVHLTYQKKLFAIHNTRGHLIWKLDDYAAKLTQAKETQSVPLRSPIFCNKQYGYTMRLEVFLNGIGTWKGRNIIACVSIVPGEYDTLLPWPVRIEAEITLRDQPENPSEAQNIRKILVAKRKNDKYETNQYIHIPHKVLTTCHYVKNDAIFFDVRILKCTVSTVSEKE
ncbi:TNF receptor-associated factor 3 [Phlebotomus argentipes]|uniref:TNF receptor-associated factor 3 n=1 Tax=Phlebotomus argentipes TaxID=94469 RepID=UPI00289324CF|nr:TNF receptor-associated factor 3 [Phlebotomus argentipes]